MKDLLAKTNVSFLPGHEGQLVRETLILEN